MTQDLVRPQERLREILLNSKSDNTRRAYRSDWKSFTSWCQTHTCQPMPASSETLALYLTSYADRGYAYATLLRWVSAINRAHQTAGYPPPGVLHDPLFHELMCGLRRTLGVKQEQAKPLLKKDLLEIFDILDLQTNKGKRDRCLLLTGFAGGFRASELVRLRFEHVRKEANGLIFYLPTSKTDQSGEGRSVGISRGHSLKTCPVEAFRLWHLALGLPATGPVLRPVLLNDVPVEKPLSTTAVWRILHKLVRQAELPAADEYSTHSLRAGLVTQAYLNKVHTKAIMTQTGHKSLKSLHRYIRDLDIFDDNPSTHLGL